LLSTRRWQSGGAWMKYGALQYYECVGEDLTAKENMG